MNKEENWGYYGVGFITGAAVGFVIWELLELLS